MSETELFIFILSDTFFANLIFIMTPELAAWAAPKLSAMNEYLIYTACFIGILLAAICNYGFGIVLERVFTSLTEENENAIKNSKNFRGFMSSLGYYLLAFSFIPIYSKFITVAAGFAKFNFPVTILMISVLKTLFYVFA